MLFWFLSGSRASVYSPIAPTTNSCVLGAPGKTCLSHTFIAFHPATIFSWESSKFPPLCQVLKVHSIGLIQYGWLTYVSVNHKQDRNFIAQIHWLCIYNVISNSPKIMTQVSESLRMRQSLQDWIIHLYSAASIFTVKSWGLKTSFHQGKLMFIHAHSILGTKASSEQPTANCSLQRALQKPRALCLLNIIYRNES